MKRLIVLAITMTGVFWTFSLGAVNSTAEPNSDATLQLTVGDILEMNAKDFAKVTGQRVTLKERITFGMVKGKLKKEVKKGNLKASDSSAVVIAAADGSFSIVAFLLALFLSVLGFLIVWLFMDGSALKSALWGLIASFIIYGALFI